MSFVLWIEDIFYLKDGRTVFAGQMKDKNIKNLKYWGHVMLDDKVVYIGLFGLLLTDTNYLNRVGFYTYCGDTKFPFCNKMQLLLSLAAD